MTDEALLKLWETEKTAPRWFRDAGETDKFSDGDYLKWCDQFEIFGLANDRAALFLKRNDAHGEIHFSIERKFTEIDALVTELESVRTRIFASGITVVTAWVAKRNTGLRNICIELGMQYHGLKKWKGESHGKIIEWMCYQVFAPAKIVERVPSIC